MAAAHGRARALRAVPRPRSAAIPRGDDTHGLLGRHAAGAGLGRSTDPRTRVGAWTPDRRRHAAGVGARGVPEARRLAQARTTLRSTGLRVGALSRRAPTAHACDLGAAGGGE